MPFAIQFNRINASKTSKIHSNFNVSGLLDIFDKSSSQMNSVDVDCFVKLFHRNVGISIDSSLKCWIFDISNQKHIPDSSGNKIRISSMNQCEGGQL